MDVLVVSAPLFALVFIGYLATFLKLVPISALPGLNTYVLYFAITAMLFRLGASTPVAEMLNPTIIVIWILGAWTVLALGIYPGLRAGLGWRDSSFGALGAAAPNLGFMGIPLVSALMGLEALTALMPVILLDIVVLQSTVLALAQRGSSSITLASQLKASSLGIIANPLLWAIVLGSAWGATGWAMAEPVQETIRLLADSATPVALFTIGAVLAREQATARDIKREGVRVYIGWLTALKLVIQPTLVWLLCLAAGAIGIDISSETTAVLVLLAALPAAANTSILAERFRADNAIVASVILASTTGGFITFNIMATLVS